MTFEEYVARSSRWVWDVIGYARTQQVRMGEDALTSLVVLGVGALEVKGARVFDMRAGEHEHGADVALWLEVRGNTWAGVAIQVKKAKLRSGTGFYEKLGHTVGGRRQVDILIDYAVHEHMTPLYALLNDAASMGACRRLGTSCCSVWDDGWAGCTVVDAAVVKQALAKRGRRTTAWIHGRGRAEAARCALCRCVREDAAGFKATALRSRELPEDVQALLESSDATVGPSSMRLEKALSEDGPPGPAFVVVVPIDRDAV